MTLCTTTDDELFRQASKLVDIYRDDITEDDSVAVIPCLLETAHLTSQDSARARKDAAH
ncbi:Hypothetical protein FKW44_004839 [Caligus rogercresseyi]|uniref:Uncharacterized protein n=1 Tax=Caligus rogercresseyi TaxID=217165 RepID=A0A7T8KAV5_CALRO|nr:Hypothetical protein FKW44_004839 [Caligus rogercresseyi]